jgi:hypothetical protein
MRRIGILTALVLVLLIAACNTGVSDAQLVMQSNANGTIAALNGQLRTAESTLAVVETLTLQLEQARTRLAIEQSNLDAERAKVAQLIAQQNSTIPNAPTPPPNPGGGGGQPVVAPVSAPTSAPAVTPTPAVNAFAIEQVVTAKGTNNADGCAVNPTTTFTSTDQRIWVVATVRNLRQGIVFTSKWVLGVDAANTKEFTYTSNFARARTCINFYIEPRTLNIGSGDYTVTLSASEGGAGGSVSFRVTGTAAGVAAPTQSR